MTFDLFDSIGSERAHKESIRPYQPWATCSEYQRVDCHASIYLKGKGTVWAQLAVPDSGLFSDIYGALIRSIQLVLKLITLLFKFVIFTKKSRFRALNQSKHSIVRLIHITYINN